jgi:hypothetical protein
MGPPQNRRSLNSDHIHGTHVPVEEPSTASIAVVVIDGTIGGLPDGRLGL